MIEPHENAPDGIVKTLHSYTHEDFPAGCAILCRCNAPLVAFAFDLIRRNRPVRMLGRELGVGLKKVLDKLKCTTSLDVRKALPEWLGRELRKAKKDSTRAALEDKVGCLMAIAKSCETVSDMKRKIDELFEKPASSEVITLATGHKAKGQEWETVFILDKFLCPSKWATAPWELTQEKNLLYVMITRAKLNLYYISSESWKTTT